MTEDRGSVQPPRRAAGLGRTAFCSSRCPASFGDAGAVMVAVQCEIFFYQVLCLRTWFSVFFALTA